MRTQGYPPSGVGGNRNTSGSSQEKIVVHTISGGPHIADRSWAEMERYGKSLRNAEGYVNSIMEERHPKRKESDDIVFSRRDLEGRQYPHMDPMVISAWFGPAKVFRILIDTGSSVNILFKHAFDKMKLSMKDVSPCNKPLHGFTGDAKIPLGKLDLFVEIGSHPRSVVRKQTFVLIENHSAYNAFLGRPALSDFQIVLAPWCLKMKLSTDNEIGEVEGDQDAARDCYVTELRNNRRKNKGKDAETTLCMKSLEA